MVLEENFEVIGLVEMPERVGEGLGAQLRQRFRIVARRNAIGDRHEPSPAASGQAGARIDITLNNRPISPSSHSRRRAAAMLSVSSGFLAAKAIARAAMPSVSRHVP